MNIKETLASLNPMTLIKKWWKSDEPMPDEIKIVFRSLYELTNQSMIAYAVEFAKYRKDADEAKTKAKADLFMRKSNKTRKKFQDELSRLNQIKSIMDENKIDIPEPKKPKEKGEES